MDDVTVSLPVLTGNLSTASEKLKKYQKTIEQEQEHFKVLQEKIKEQIQLKSLDAGGPEYGNAMRVILRDLAQVDKQQQSLHTSLAEQAKPVKTLAEQVLATTNDIQGQIGRASCRERV